MDLIAADGGGGATDNASDQARRRIRGYSPLGTVTLANAGNGVALEASLASDLLDVDVEETSEPLGVDVLGRLEGVAALDLASVTLVGGGTSSEDRGGNSGDGEDGGELEHGDKLVG